MRKGSIRVGGWTTAAYSSRLMTDDGRLVLLDVINLAAISFATANKEPLTQEAEIVRLAFTKAFLHVNVDWGFGDYLEAVGEVASFNVVSEMGLKQYRRFEQLFHHQIQDDTQRFLLALKNENYPQLRLIQNRIARLLRRYTANKITFEELIDVEQRLGRDDRLSFIRQSLKALIKNQIALRYQFRQQLNRTFPVINVLTNITHVKRLSVGLAPDRLSHAPQKAYFDQPGYVHAYFKTVTDYYAHWRTLGLPAVPATEADKLPIELQYLTTNTYKPDLKLPPKKVISHG